jgi:hypothetical protein
MSSEAEFVIELWESVRDHVKHSSREEVATGILQAVLNYGIEYADIANIEDDEQFLGDILKSLCEDEIQEEHEDEY